MHNKLLPPATIARLNAVMGKLYRLSSEWKLSRRKERNLALSKGKRGMKRPKGNR